MGSFMGSFRNIFNLHINEVIMKNYYEILGIQNEASADEIKKAYRKLSLKFHPDKNDNDLFFSDMFRNITEAYNVLNDPKKREIYNQQLTGKKEDTKEIVEFDSEIIDAALVIIKENVASLTILQRKLLIGYSKAGRLMSQLEQLKIISPPNIKSERTIMVNFDGLEKILKNNFPDYQTTNFSNKSRGYENKVSDKKTKSYYTIWDDVKMWRNIKIAFFLFDILLLVIIFREPLLNKILGQSSEHVEQVHTNAFVTAKSGLRLRTNPDNFSSILGSIPFNAKVEILDENGPSQNINGVQANWFQLKYQNKVGWSWGGFIEKD